MLDGMRMAAQGMLAQSARQDIITNNLANVSSAGFRKESLMISSFTEILNREVGMEGMTQAGGELTQAGGMSAAGGLGYQTVTHTNQGSLKETGNPFDLSLDDNGRGFFTIQTQEGIKFTRAGNFKLSTSGYLVTADGSFVLGHRGPIKLNGTDFKVDEQGNVMVDGRPVDRLLITTFDDPREMRKAGDNQFVAGQGQV
ncbi:MAG TPA: flagellar hook-basal body complex protein, partial [Candidatus Nitrosotenuis sp.]|nr:flagellar hook-basal body complex protein [Candidatus Nitrosotenuis sp.]